MGIGWLSLLQAIPSVGSKGVNKNESQVVTFSIFQLPSLDSDINFIEYIVSSRASALNMGRFENRENRENREKTENISSLNGPVCVKYHSISQDTNAKIQGGKASMLFENIGYNCQHSKKYSRCTY
jgi:hypothetical protein